MQNIPCENCLMLVMCRQYTKGRPGLVEVLSRRCPLFNKYIEVNKHELRMFAWNEATRLFGVWCYVKNMRDNPK